MGLGRGLDRLRRPAADNTANSFMNQVVGNKKDAAAVGAVSDAETLMAYLKQLVGAGIQEFIAGTVDTSPLASMSLWTITGGPVMVHEIIGVVATVIQTQATTTKLILDPTDGGANVDLCSAGEDISADATGTLYRWTKDFSEGLVALLDASEATDIQAPGVILMPGDIEVVYGAASTGVVNWYCRYSSLGGILAAA
jgi:hypothetical protein